MQTFLRALLLALALFAATRLSAQAPTQPTSGYGADSTFAVTTATFASPHPSGIGFSVTFFRPAQATGPVPTVLLSHGYGGVITDAYIELMTHIVSRGYAVVFSPYPLNAPTSASVVNTLYDVLWAGFEEAVKRYPQYIDTTRMAFIGHSLGGGATPWVAHKAMVEKGWAAQGAAIMTLAPWYSFRMTDAQYAAIPAHTVAVMQAYADDATCDHRLAQDQYKAMTAVPDSNKALLMVYPDSRNGVTLKADHYAPNGARTPVVGATTDAIDFYAIYRIFDALCDLSLRGVASARQECLGNGSARQLFMGNWGDGTPFRPMALGTDALIAGFRESQFNSPCTSVLNPRANKCTQLTAISEDIANLSPDARPVIGPNPSTGGSLTLTWPQPLSGAVSLQAYDITGRLLAQTTAPAGSDQLVLSTESWPAGLCLLQATAANGQRFTQTLVLVR